MPVGVVEAAGGFGLEPVNGAAGFGEAAADEVTPAEDGRGPRLHVEAENVRRLVVRECDRFELGGDEELGSVAAEAGGKDRTQPGTVDGVEAPQFTAAGVDEANPAEVDGLWVGIHGPDVTLSEDDGRALRKDVEGGEFGLRPPFKGEGSSARGGFLSRGVGRSEAGRRRP